MLPPVGMIEMFESKDGEKEPARDVQSQSLARDEGSLKVS
jgi:hypothetical protein